MTDQPFTSPRDGVLAFADYLTQNDMPAPLPSATYAELAREFADTLPDEPESDPEIDITIRAIALQCTTRLRIGQGSETPVKVILDDAEKYAAWLRGDR